MKVLMLTATLLMTQSVFAQVSKEAKDVHPTWSDGSAIYTSSISVE